VFQLTGASEGEKIALNKSLEYQVNKIRELEEQLIERKEIFSDLFCYLRS